MLLALFRTAVATTRARLLLLVVAILAPFAVFALLLFLRLSQTEQARYSADAIATAELLSSAIDRELEALTAAVEALAVSPSLGPGGDLEAFRGQADQVLRNRGYSVVLRDASGRHLVSTQLPEGAALPASSGPEQLAVTRAVFASGQRVISDLVTNLVSHRQLIVVAAPVFHGNRIVYALSIALDPNHLSAVLAEAARPGWTIALVDRNDRLIASSRENPAFVGREATADLRRETRGSSGTWIGKTLEGTDVLGAYARSPISGWRVAVGVPLEAIAAPLRRLTLITALSGVLVGLLALGLARWLARSISWPIAQLAHAAEGLGAGEPMPKIETGLREVDEVGAALAHAHATVKAQEAAVRDLNVTLERRVEQASAERDRIWRISTELMLVARLSGRILAVNPAWTQTLGWSESELVGGSFFDLIDPSDRPETEAATDRLVTDATALSVENRCRHKDGSYRWLAWTMVPDAGALLAIARDVTSEKAAAEALRQTEAQLRQSQKMEVVGQLTGGVAHDFNNLLTVVTGHLEMARRRLTDGGDAARLPRHLDSALEGARRAAVLTHRLLAFSRQSPLTPERVALDTVITGMADLIRRTLGETIEIQTSFADSVWPVEADLNQIENAILNLCVNARDAMPAGGVLRIAIENRSLAAKASLVQRGELAAGDYAVVSVEDTGTGIPKEIQDRVFEPFFTTKPIGEGTGLGLSQVFGFMRQSGGSAAIDSAPGRGTTVALYFPRLMRSVAGAGRADEPGEAAPGGAARGETCLVVEDEEMVRAFTVSALEEAGYRVVATGDGAAGLKLLDRHPEIRLLFTDIVLAGSMDGRAVAEEALRRRPDLKVLLTTGYSRDVAGSGERIGGEIEIIRKPFVATALIAKISSILAPVC